MLLEAQPLRHLIDVLRNHAETRPQKTALVELVDGEREGASLTYRELDEAARSLALRLIAEDLAGKRAVFLYPNGLNFMVAFWACLYAGVQPVPVVLPLGASRFWQRIDGIAADARAAAVLSDRATLREHQADLDSAPFLSSLKRLRTDVATDADSDAWTPPAIGPDSLAFLQYTSGSTRRPRGVEVSHGNLLHNHALMIDAYGLGTDDRYVSWLPLYHDLGLIGNFLHSIYLGASLVIMTPMAFVQKPLRWMQAISKYRATASFGPNFAYELCVRRISEEERRDLDLSSWRVAVNGAEPVRAVTLDRFGQTFASCGFRATTWNPAYGLAESTLTVSATPRDEPPQIAVLDAAAYADGRVQQVPDGEVSGIPLVSAGRVVGQEVRIVDPDSHRALPADAVGEVWVRGDSVARGYWGDPPEGAETFGATISGPDVEPQDAGPFLRTGDLGFFLNGHLYLSGRTKDLIILRGRNIYPQDLELTASEAHPALRPGRSVGFTVDPSGEAVVVVQEVLRSRLKDLDADEVLRHIRNAILDEHEVDPHAIILLPPDVLPKTSSGKLQRRYTRDLLLAGELPEIDRLEPGTVIEHSGGVTLSGLEERLARIVAEAAGLESTAIDPTRPLAHLGFDSAGLVALSGQIAEQLDRPLSPTALYRHPTLRRLASFLTKEAEPRAETTPRVAVRPVQEHAVAVIGIGCRLPGDVSDPDDLWRLVASGRGVVGQPSASRQALIEGIRSDRHPDAGYLDDVAGFDAGFFRLGAAEANALDPQQRLLLEVAWHALEDAGVPPTSIAGSRGGVFMGISFSDYARLQAGTAGARGIWAGTGGALSIAANRLSYFFDLHGPSLAIDTACSSSLVALHNACRSLRAGECELALAGGVNLVLDPEVTSALDAAGMMAADGRCKVFDARADGYVRGEGAVVLVLKPLERALADGDPIRAVIRGTAVSQDGRSNGLTAPNGLAQEAVIADALQDAGLEPAAVDLVEAHGTGTALGDPIEIEALAGVYGLNRPSERPLRVTSIKANIGHLESAAGAAGLAKAILALEQGEIPPQHGLETPNPHIPWDRVPVEVPLTLVPWTPGGEPRRAGVSSFGFGGTNAHVILEQAPEPRTPARPAEPTEERGHHLLPLAAATPTALARLAERHAERLEHGASLADLCFNAARSRAQDLACRAAPVATDRQEMADRLRGLAKSHHLLETGRTPKLALLFSGQGADPRAEIRQLEQAQPVVRHALDVCAEAIAPLDPRALLGADRPLTAAEAQPALFALQYALGELWQSWGLEPTAVLGHSVGEFAAATLCGVFEPRDAARLVAARGELMARLARPGAMATVFLAAEDLEQILDDRHDVAIAAINSPRQAVLSGGREPVAEVCSELEASGVQIRRLPVDHGFHAPPIEPALEAFGRRLEMVEMRPPRPGQTYISGTTGRPAGAEVATVQYWLHHARETVRFADGLRGLAELGCEALIEVGPGSSLAAFSRETLGEEALAVPSLRRSVNSERQILSSLGKLWEAGLDIDGLAFGPPVERRRIDLPLYPFEHRQYWFATPISAEEPAETCAEIVWQDAGPLRHPETPAIGHTLAAELKNAPVDAELAAYRQALEELDDIARSASWAALIELGLRPRTPDSPEALREALGIRSLYRPLLETWLPRFEKSGGFAKPPVPGAAPLERLDALRRRHPVIAPEITLVERGAGSLAGVLRGDVDPLELLFPAGDLSLATSAYSRSVPGRRINGLLGRLLGELASPVGELRILEVGAGTGSTTRALLPVLEDAADASYTFTDLSPTFLRRARAELGAAGRAAELLETQLFDVERDPVSQGFDVGSYDVVVAANVLHATRDLAQTARHVARLLRPGGHLLLFEAHQHRPWLDLCFGLTEGWWRFDDGRRGGPLLDVTGWRDVLTSAGFETVESPTEGTALEDTLEQGVIVARRACRTAAIGTWWIDAGGRESLTSALREAIETLGGHAVEERENALKSDDFRGAVVAHRADPPDLDRPLAEPSGSSAWIDLAREAGQQNQLDGNTLVLMTRGAVAAGGETPEPLASLPWGVAQSLALERPETDVLRLDLDDVESAAWGQALVDLLLRPEEEMAIRSGRRHVPRLTGRDESTTAWTPTGDGVYLVTGGLGGLGLALARWLIGRGARRLMLAGRRPPSDAARPLVEELRAAGAVIETAQADIGDAGAVAELLTKARRLGPLRGIFHAAGVGGGGRVEHLERQAFEDVLRPKAVGALHLDRTTREDPLDVFVLFSSGAAVWGAKEQGAYAAANRFLDQLAWQRHSRKLPALSVNWGYLPAGGLVTGLGDGYQRIGLLPLDAERGFDRMAELLASGVPQATVARADWRRLSRALSVGRRRRLLDRLVPTDSPGPSAELKATAPIAGAAESSTSPPRRASDAATLEDLVAASFEGPQRPLDRSLSLSELGFDSLMAVELGHRLEKELGISAPLSRLLGDTPLGELANHLLGISEVKPEEAPAPAESDARFPLSEGQQALWHLHRRDPEDPSYHVVHAARLKPTVDLDHLRQVLLELVRRRPMLRARFDTEDGEPFQRVEPWAEDVLEIRQHDVEDITTPLDRWIDDCADRPFNLDRGPIRADILMRQGRPELMVLGCHHLVVDFRTLELIFRDLTEIDAEISGARHVSPQGGSGARRAAGGSPGREPWAEEIEPAPRYRDFVAWQGQHLDGPAGETLERFWRQSLADAHRLDLPIDHARPRRPSGRGKRHVHHLPATLAERLRGTARGLGVTPFALVLGAYAAVLGQAAGQHQITVGIPALGRRAEDEDVVGYFVNVLPISLQLARQAPLGKLLTGVRNAVTQAFDHQHFPFPRLLRDSDVDLVRTVFVWDRYRDDAAQGADGGLFAERLRSEQRGAAVDLAVTVFDRGDGLEVDWSYARDLLDRSTVARLARRFSQALDQITDRPTTRLSEMALLPEAERHQALYEWAGPESHNPPQAVAFQPQRGYTQQPRVSAASPWVGDPEKNRTLKGFHNEQAQLDQAVEPLQGSDPASSEPRVARRFAPADPGLSSATPSGLMRSASRLSSDGNLLHDRVKDQAHERPDAVAVCDSHQTLTYGRLMDRARHLAGRLAARGIGPESRIGLLLGRSADLAIAILGVLESGAAYVPLDPALPDSRLRWMLDDADLDAILVEPSWAHRCTGIRCLRVHGETEASRPPAVSPTPDQLAYMTYTSGSTGRPKAVLTPHRGVAAMLDADAAALATSPKNRCLHFVEASFDAATLHLFRGLRAGATVVLAERELLRSPQRLREALVRERIDLCSFPASVLAAMGSEDRELDALATLTVGAEACPPEVARRWSRGRRLFNMYGPTETAIVATRGRLRPTSDVESVPIGRPAAEAQAWVADESLRTLPLGSGGELVIGGRGVARGYHRRPRLSAERFVPDPFGTHAGGRLYRTGDRVRFRGDGNLEFLGRLDDQVKIRGLRIEPGEIEAALANSKDVERAMVIAREDRPGERRLVAYVTPAPDASPDGATLRGQLSERLPATLIPAAVVVLDAFPLTARGKIDTRRLPAPAERSSFEPPVGHMEALVATVWGEVMERSGIGRRDDFFALGGHSLMAARVQARLEERLATRVPLELLFEQPVLADLAAALAITSDTANVLETHIPTDRRPEDGRFPLSFGQRRLWFLQQLRPGETAHNMVGAFRLQGRLDPDAFRAALDAVVARHEILRCRFIEEDGTPFGIVGPAGVALPIVDASRVDSQDVADRLIAAEVRHAFDLASGRLLRALLLREAPDRHLLILNQHHIISDGWSLTLMWQELGELYRAAIENRRPTLETLPLQYGDYAAWQASEQSEERLAADLEAWRRHLEGAPEEITLPADGPRGGTEGIAAMVSHTFPPRLATALRDLGQARGATLFMTLLSLFGAVLARLAGQSDLVIGAPSVNRRPAVLERLIGFFLDTLALRVHTRRDDTFDDLLARVRRQVLDAGERQEVPFERLVEALSPRRDATRHPIFQTFFNLVNVPPPNFDLPGLEITPVHQHEALAKFDLTLYAHDLDPLGDDDGLRLDLSYDAARFTRGRMRELLRQLETLAQQVVISERPLATLPLLSESARQQLTTPHEPLPERPDLPALFLSAAAQHPDRAAMVDADGSVVSWAALEKKSAALAYRLRAAGVTPESIVAIRASRDTSDWGVDLVTALLAVLRAGGAFWILDGAHPAERLRRQRQAIESATGRPVIDVPVLRSDGTSADPVPEAQLPPSPSLDALAYIAVTSGSTGEPKVIAGRHGSLTFAADWMRRRFDLRPGDRFSLLSGLSHDPLHRDVFLALQTGATIHVPTARDLAAGRLAPWLTERGIEVANLTPSLGQLAWGDLAAELPALRRVFFGGEALTRADVRALQRAAPNARAVNLYGTTETSQALAFATPSASNEDTVPPDSLSPGRVVLSIGRGTGGTQLRLRTAAGPAGLGELAEIALESPHLTRGYADDPALTAERFVPAEGGGRLYLAGDLGRLRPDGTIEIVGRRDRQLKLNGVRLEPTEITDVLRRHPRIRDAAVVLGPDGVLVAYIVGRDTTPELRKHIAEHLPRSMMPGRFVALEELPRTPNGKLDWQALPAPEPFPTATEPTTTAPRTPFEELIASVWTELLGRDEIDVEQDFFALGGHSLLATRVLSRVREMCGVALEVADLFEAPTVAGLAARAEALHGTSRELPELCAADPVASDPRAPLAFPQERLWFLDQLEGPSAAYNIPAALRLHGDLDLDALDNALSSIVARHAVLRARVVDDEGVARQVIDPELEIPLAIEDISANALNRRLAELAAQPFDLTRAPLARWSLLCLGPSEHVLAAVFHHLIADGWSLAVLTSELRRLYAADEPTDVLEPLPLQYTDFARWQHRAEPLLKRQVAWWQTQLDGIPPSLDLPFDRPRPETARHRGATVVHRLPEDLLDTLRTTGKHQGATLFMVLLAAFATQLYRLSGARDLVVGTAVANRRDPRLEGLIGFFANTLALRLKPLGERTFAELLAEARRVVLDASAHQDVPFERVVDAVSPERNLARAPIFQTLLTLQHAPTDVDDGAANGLRIEPVFTATDASRLDLSLSAIELDTGGLRLALEFDTDLFDQTTAKRWLSSFAVLTGEICKHTESPIEHLDSLGPAQRHQLLEWGNGQPAEPSDDFPATTVLDLVAGHARRTPEAAALEVQNDWLETLSYAALEHRAAVFARLLAGRGVGLESRVGVALPRDADFIAAVLGILRAGGAYVPLDLRWPEDRLRFVAEDADLEVLIAERRWGWVPDAIELIRPEDVTGDPAPASPALSPAQAAYVIYTSGSTGRPKGVTVNHGGLVNLVRSQLTGFAVDPGDRVLQFSSPAFDASVSEIFATLAAGAVLLLPGRQDLLDSADPGDWLRRRRISHVTLPPSLLRVLEPDSLPWVETLVSAGEAMTPELVSRWASSCRFINGYGPTEGTIGAAIHRCRPGDMPVIGRPMRGVEIHLTDPDLRRVPAGATGEVSLTGAGITRGYSKDPARTASRFVPSPFAGPPGARLYRTGDLGRWCSNGTLDFLGRLDRQVQVRGLRVEPGEIEAVVATLPGVTGAAVELIDGIGWVAWVAVEDDFSSDFADTTLARRLPEHMRPASWVEVDALPLTTAGKIDRTRLPKPERAAPSASHEPRDELETILTEVWQEVLNVPEVGIGDNFFRLGGDSITSLRLVAAARHREIVFSPRQLFEHQTIAALASAIRQAPIEDAARAPTAPRPTAGAEIPLTPVQRWFFRACTVDPHHFNQAVLLVFDRALGVPQVERWLSVLSETHDACRLRFSTGTDGEIRQLYGEPAFELEHHQLEGEDWRHQITARAETVQASFDLATGPLFRAALFEPPDGEPTRLLLVAHHLVVDAVSWHVLLADFEHLCRQSRAGEELRLEPPPSSFGAWASHSKPEPPSDSLPSPTTGTVGTARRLELELSAEQTQTLLQDARRGAILDALLAALARAFISWGPPGGVRVDLEHHGRDGELDLSRTVGWLTRLQNLELHADALPDLESTLAAVRDARQSAPGGDFATRGDVLINYLGRLDDEPQVAGDAPFLIVEDDTGATRSPRQPRFHALELSAWVRRGTLSLKWTFSPEMHDEASVASLAESHLEFLNRLAGGESKLPQNDIPEGADELGLDGDALDSLLADLPSL